tara:strand:+ start:175 stop:456 length:282 start_codon:yes stop_codon:yes gene_type:complete
MKKLKIVITLGLVALFLTGCAITLPVAATSNAVGSKVGTSTATGYFGVLFFDADASIRSAAANGGITKISTVDVKVSTLLNIITTYECIVTGS